MDPLGLLCDTHVIPIILFLEERGTCGRTEVYRNVSRASSMSSKLDLMESAGIIFQNRTSVSTLVGLTPKGTALATELHRINEVLEGEYH